MVTKRIIREGNIHLKLLVMFELHQWDKLPTEKQRHPKIVEVMTNHQISWKQVHSKFTEWKKDKKNDKDSNNNDTSNNNTTNKNNNNTENNANDINNNTQQKEKQYGIYTSPPSLQSIDLAIDDLMKTESYIHADKNIRSIIVSDRFAWECLQNALIDAIKILIEKTRDTKSACVRCANEFTHIKKEILDQFSHQWDDVQVVDQPPYAVSATAYILGVTFCRRLQVALGNTAGPLNINQVINDIDDIEDVASIPPSDDLAKQAIYYIVGWLLYACEKRAGISAKGNALNRFLPDLVSNNITTSTSEREGLPTQLVEDIEAFDGMKYPSNNFYMYVCVLEKVVSNILTTENLIFTGATIFQELNKCLSNSNTIIINYLKPCFNDDIIMTIDDCTECNHFIVKTFNNMRGKDFIRNFMNQYQKGPQVGLRQTMAVLANEENYKDDDNNKKRKDNDNNNSNCVMQTDIDDSNDNILGDGAGSTGILGDECILGDGDERILGDGAGSTGILGDERILGDGAERILGDGAGLTGISCDGNISSAIANDTTRITNNNNDDDDSTTDNSGNNSIDELQQHLKRQRKSIERLRNNDFDDESIDEDNTDNNSKNRDDAVHHLLNNIQDHVDDTVNNVQYLDCQVQAMIFKRHIKDVVFQIECGDDDSESDDSESDEESDDDDDYEI